MRERGEEREREREYENEHISICWLAQIYTYTRQITVLSIKKGLRIQANTVSNLPLFSSR